MVRWQHKPRVHGIGASSLEHLRTMMERGDKLIGTISDDEDNLGAAMLDDLGPIDTRPLTQEVSRCYSEVFEHFFQRLDKPDDERDFEKQRTRLGFLKALPNRKKRPLSDF
jgi:hypothetical protein